MFKFNRRFVFIYDNTLDYGLVGGCLRTLLIFVVILNFVSKLKLLSEEDGCFFLKVFFRRWVGALLIQFFLEVYLKWTNILNMYHWLLFDRNAMFTIFSKLLWEFTYVLLSCRLRSVRKMDAVALVVFVLIYNFLTVLTVVDRFVSLFIFKVSPKFVAWSVWVIRVILFIVLVILVLWWFLLIVRIWIALILLRWWNFTIILGLHLIQLEFPDEISVITCPYWISILSCPYWISILCRPYRISIFSKIFQVT